MRRFADAEVVPHAQGWHRANAYIPLEVIEGLARHGRVRPDDPRGLTAAWGSARSRCASSRRSCRAAISASARSAPARRSPPSSSSSAARDAQKQKYLPKIASGEILPTAVFTEPNTGSDLASPAHPRGPRRRRLRGQRGQDLDHPSRARRPDDAARRAPIPNEPGYKGLSMFLAEKPRGTDADPFPAPRACRAARSRCSAIAA